MSDATRDRIEGTVDEATGRGKSAFGELTGDEQTQAEGTADRAEGKGQGALGQAKEAVGDAADKAKDTLKR